MKQQLTDGQASALTALIESLTDMTEVLLAGKFIDLLPGGQQRDNLRQTLATVRRRIEGGAREITITARSYRVIGYPQ